MRRSTIVVLVLFALLLAVYFYLQKNPLPKAESDSPTPTPVETLLNLDPASVTGVVIQAQDGQVTGLVRQDTGWQLIQPVSEPADTAAVDSALQNLASLTVQDRLLTPPTDELMGFNDPLYTIIFTLQGGQATKLVLGSETPLKTGYYARLDSRSAVAVAKFPLASLTGMAANPPRLPTPTPAEAAP